MFCKKSFSSLTAVVEAPTSSQLRDAETEVLVESESELSSSVEVDQWNTLAPAASEDWFGCGTITKESASESQWEFELASVWVAGSVVGTMVLVLRMMTEAETRSGALRAS